MYESYLSETVSKVKKSGIREFFDIAKKVDGVISLSVGEPDFQTPWHIKEEAIYAIEQGNTFYTENLGLPKLREAVCDYLERSLKISYQPAKNVLVSVGASEAIDVAMRTLINPGDEVILLTPCYVMYEPCVRLCGGVPVYIELKEENGFKLTKEALLAAISDKTKLILINYPSNPTGGIMEKEDYDQLVSVIEDSKILVLSDEIYCELQYEGTHTSLAQYPSIKDQVLIVNGFSKAYAMTGYRLGYIVAHEIFIEAMCKIHQYTIMNPTTSSQYAGIRALNYGDADSAYMKEEFLKRRNYLVNQLNRIGLNCPMPKGAFYVFASIKDTGLTSHEFCTRLVHQEKLAIVPGSAFGSAGEGFIRISYAYSLAELKEAVVRIERFIQSLK
ncbi:MAG: pyridoxal phosphate-dependent aminotransferase [Erysipelotrichaceae bacterium]